MEMPLEKIIPLWQSYLQEVAQRRTEVLSLPLSTVFESKAGDRSTIELRPDLALL
jgi:hypothetical protein